MIRGGAKPKPTLLRVITGNPSKRPIPKGEPVPAGRPIKPKSLKGRAAKLWDEFIEPAFWLGGVDGYKAFMWCQLAAEFERDSERMVAGRIGQLRGLGSELGFDPAARARLGTKDEKPKTDADKYLK